VCAVAVRDTRVPPASSYMIVVRTPAVWGTAERRGGRAAGAPAAGQLGLGLGHVRDRRRRLAVVRGRLHRLGLGCDGLSLPRAAPPQRRRARSWGTRTVRPANALQCRSGGGEKTLLSTRTLASFSASRSSFVISGTASPPALRAARPAFFRHRHTHTLPRLLTRRAARCIKSAGTGWRVHLERRAVRILLCRALLREQLPLRDLRPQRIEMDIYFTFCSVVLWCCA
jgi:hypothetical protein